MLPRRLLLLLCSLAAACAQTPDWPNPISTDRPAVADSSTVVPRWLLQVENGFLDTAANGAHTLDFPESLIRFGVGPSTELRFTVPDYFSSSGFEDFTLGAKQQLLNSSQFQLAGVLSLTFPTGARGVSAGHYDPSIQFPWSAKLSGHWTAAGMMSVYATAQDGARGALGETTFLIDRQLTRPWDAFVEYAGDFPSAGTPRHLLHIGTSYKTTPRQQFDFHFGFGLSSAAPDYIVGFGYSFCIGLAKP